MLSLTIDGISVEASPGLTLLEAAQRGQVYIPRLCHHPDLPSPQTARAVSLVYRGGEGVIGDDSGEVFAGCGLCAVEVEGGSDLALACDMVVAEGMVVHTDTPRLREIRQQRLSTILANHPHTCLTCAQREGCSREPCSLNVPVEERCCSKFGNCELRKVAEYVGIKVDTPRYRFRNLPVTKNEPLFSRDHNLCIGCTRCVRACSELRGVGALGFAHRNGEVAVGTIGPSLQDSGCRFCGACVEVCPTGALMDKGVKGEREAFLLPCVHACPAGVDVPRYLHLVARGQFSEATAVVRERVPFPGALGRVCFHPCESVCRRGEVDEALAICALKRAAADGDAGLWKANVPSVLATGKRVAIVGSGPAGLTAAYYLARLGHGVTVFESQEEAGGMMQMGIPTYRLPRDVLKKEVTDILERGVEFKGGASVGDAWLNQQGYDAIFIAVGAQLSRKLNIPRIELEGIVWGVDFMRGVNQGLRASVGERVVVIGGGNVAMDVALTARRLGAREVQLACLESREEMPAHPWEIQEAVEEGVVIHPSWGPKAILGDEGRVTGIELVRCTSVFDREGKFNPTYDSSVVSSLDADMVIVAIGQAVDLSFVKPEDGVKVNRGLIVADERLATTRKGVFAGGEAVTGPSSVIHAIAAGRKAAVAVDRYLGGRGIIDETLIPFEEPNPWLGREEGFAPQSRAPMPCLPVAERHQSFAEVELGFNPEMAQQEARRCLQCHLRLRITPVTLPPEPWLEFNQHQLSQVPSSEGVYQLLDAEKKVILILGTPNLSSDLAKQLSSNPKAKFFAYWEEKMYTRRESELIQQFTQKHGRLPEGNELSEDLFD
ncbi:MAG: FAD-dependent oxidoreductase [Chloroflexi bacterium]|nr:FAD-dependent oxidoreductase [Chloroflexota bacterium]